MKLNTKKFTAAAATVVVGVSAMPKLNSVDSVTMANAASGNVLEYLDRGISAINTGSGMLISWRYLANDDDNAVYKLYRDGMLIRSKTRR